MTEITEYMKTPLWPAQPTRRQLLDPVAFVLAFVTAPLVVSALTFYLVVPVAALMLGGPIYVVIGLPVLLWWSARHEIAPRAVARLAFSVALALLIMALLAIVATQAHQVYFAVLIFGGFGLIFAPVWGAMFAVLYTQFRRDLYAPNPS